MAREDLESKIFISYAAADDVPPPFDDKVAGFVTFLYQQLAFELANHGESENIIFFDRERSRPGVVVAVETRKMIVDAHILILVLSPNWMASARCREELLTFTQSKGDLGQRIVIVTKTPVQRERLPQLLQHKSQFAFYTRGDIGDASVHEFYWRGLRDGKNILKCFPYWRLILLTKCIVW